MQIIIAKKSPAAKGCGHRKNAAAAKKHCKKNDFEAVVSSKTQ